MKWFTRWLRPTPDPDALTWERLIKPPRVIYDKPDGRERVVQRWTAQPVAGTSPDSTS